MRDEGGIGGEWIEAFWQTKVSGKRVHHGILTNVHSDRMPMVCNAPLARVIKIWSIIEQFTRLSCEQFISTA